MVKYLRGPCVSCRTLVTGAEGTDITCPNCHNTTRVPWITPPTEPPVPAFEPEPVLEAAPEPLPELTLDATTDTTDQSLAGEPAEWPAEDAFEPVPDEASDDSIFAPTPASAETTKSGPAPAGRGALLRALLGGALGALLGAIAWGLLAKLMDTEDSNALGFVAIIVGLVCGAMVLLFTLRNEGIALKVVAVLATVFGIFGGKYLLYYVDQKSFGGSVMDRIGYAFDPAVIGDFFNEVGTVFNALDIVWILVALAVAWMIPRPYFLGIKSKNKTKAASA